MCIKLIKEFPKVNSFDEHFVTVKKKKVKLLLTNYEGLFEKAQKYLVSSMEFLIYLYIVS